MCNSLQRIGVFKSDQFSKSSKFRGLSNPAIWKKAALGKRPTFLGSEFSCERDRQSTME
jgi:hypothetical protein